ncbi:MAG: hypothetical protein WBG37_03610, partial [Desulfobacterales bacterium]
KSILTLILSMISMVLVVNSKAIAGPYTDDLSKCIISSTTATDREDLIKWMFSAISLHPVVEGMSSVSQAQMDNASKSVAKMFERLMAEDCLKPTKEAIQYEGPSAIGSSFNFLGQVAAKEIFQHKNVATAISDLEQHFDVEKFKEKIKKVE